MALAAPLLADESGLQGDQRRRQPDLRQPGGVRAARHRRPRARRADPVHLGRAHQPAGGPGRDGAGGADRLDRRNHRRLLRRPDRRPPDADHRVVPRDPVPAAGDRARRDPGAVGAQHHHRDRDHVVAAARAPDPSPGAHAEGARLRGPQPRAGRLELAPDDAPHPAERVAADPRQHHAHGADRDPLRGDALVPGARRPAQPVLGPDARQTPSSRARSPPRRGGCSSRRASGSCSWRSRSRCAGRRSRRSSTRG